ncbi:BZ3500_MvSof-1268-A1-R1_Chr8-2g10126 [Microbotryum saponariae]|uniref:BZ3500_MvSof-1268-A1-R1_Chr8-2g10126 protein n=1 Tax=Microbotryum saponariae TaxID=289078 RepID=A0A2X0KWW2_9BASI|nr:BZ3500_MvSof-1268-A1-R1_Chr8-2g10126 [Microbotryum saponariae]SDA01838.1 BZ3501_MvSof-1269-A2-R1_Chr8-2g09877 [Microbotryum saponariae]
MTAVATMTYNPSSHIFPGKLLPPVAALIGHGNGHTTSSANGKGSPLREVAPHHHHVGAGGAGSSSHHSGAGSVSDAISIHSQASTSTTGNSMYRNATYSPPPGLSIETEADDYLGQHDFGHEESLQAFVSSNAFPTHPQPSSSLPRSARIDQSSSIPAAAQWLLSTSPPTVRRAASTSSSSRPASYSVNGRPSSSYSILQNGSSSSNISSQRSYELDSTSNSEYSGYSSTSSGKGLSWGKKSLSSAFWRGPRRQNSRPEPKPITLQLSRPNPNRSGRLDSATSPVEVPQVWDDWIKQYANGGMDVENPPRPPPPMASNTFPSLHASSRSSRNPAEEGKLSAPNQPLESVRQKMIARLELFGPTEITSARTASRMVTPIASSSSSQFTQGTDRNSSLFDRRASNGSTAQSSVSATSSESTPAFLNSAGSNDVPEPPSCLSFANHPSLASILRRAKNTFGVRIVLVTVLLEDKQRFLAATGMPKGVESLPREVTFCAHTVLNGERGLVVLDTQRDWRFRNNILSVSVNARLYAGMPIYPPSNAELEEEAGGRLPIGTLCLLDDRPRTEFTQSERAQLRALASDVSVEIEAWFSELRSSVVSHSSSMADLSHNQVKQVAFDEPSPSSGYTDWNGLKTPVASTFPNSSPSKIMQSPASVSSIKPALKCRTNDPATYTAGSLSSHVPQALPPTPEEETARHLHTGRSQKIKPRTKPEIPVRDVRRSAVSPEVNPATSSPESSACSQNVSPTFIRQTFPSAKTRPQPRTPHQKLLDSAIKSLGDRLALSLVYLVSMSNLSEEGPHALALLSAHNPPATTPSFDSALHLKALRAAEGGLLYRNPAIATLGPNEEFQGPGFASGILLPVAEREGMGWVLAGYTKDATRVFSEEELDRFVDISAQLAQLVAEDPSTMDAEL